MGMFSFRDAHWKALEKVINELEGFGALGDFGGALKEPGVKVLYVHRPQVEGRIKRRFGTLQ